MIDSIEIADRPSDAPGDLMAPAEHDSESVHDSRLAERQLAYGLIAHHRETLAWQQINEWEKFAAEQPQPKCPLRYEFFPGMATRIIEMPAGARLTSKIHLLEHPFFVMRGAANVWTLETGWQLIRAPHFGRTMPGTRRLLHIIEDCTWLTAHVTKETDEDKIDAEIFYDHMKLGHMDSVSPERLAIIRQNQKATRHELC